MAKARRHTNSPAVAPCYASILEAEAQAREAVQVCQQQHDQAVTQAKEQAARIQTRAQRRITRIQARQAERMQALSKEQGQGAGPGESQAASAPEGCLAKAVARLAARLTGGRP